VRSGGRALYLRPRAKALVDSAQLAQAIESCFVRLAAPALEDGLLVPGEAEVLEVAKDIVEMVGPAARAVQILDAKQKAAARGSDLEPSQESGSRIAQVKPAGGTGSESSSHRSEDYFVRTRHRLVAAFRTGLFQAEWWIMA